MYLRRAQLLNCQFCRPRSGTQPRGLSIASTERSALRENEVKSFHFLFLPLQKKFRQHFERNHFALENFQRVLHLAFGHFRLT
jgi:hypothetical protein